jgi:hypothetical protein
MACAGGCRGAKQTARAVSSAVERFVYTEDVGGSIPSPPTTTFSAITVRSSMFTDIGRASDVMQDEQYRQRRTTKLGHSQGSAVAHHQVTSAPAAIRAATAFADTS